MPVCVPPTRYKKLIPEHDDYLLSPVEFGECLGFLCGKTVYLFMWRFFTIIFGNPIKFRLLFRSCSTEKLWDMFISRRLTEATVPVPGLLASKSQHTGYRYIYIESDWFIVVLSLCLDCRYRVISLRTDTQSRNYH